MMMFDLFETERRMLREKYPELEEVEDEILTERSCYISRTMKRSALNDPSVVEYLIHGIH